MTQPLVKPLHMFSNGVKQAIGPADSDTRVWYESLIRADYERSHPGDTLDGLKQRASVLKEDKGLLRDWMALAAARAKQDETRATPAKYRSLAA